MPNFSQLTPDEQAALIVLVVFGNAAAFWLSLTIIDWWMARGGE